MKDCPIYDEIHHVICLCLSKYSSWNKNRIRKKENFKEY